MKLSRIYGISGERELLDHLLDLLYHLLDLLYPKRGPSLTPSSLRSDPRHNERGSKGKNALVEVDFYMSQPGTWPNAEDILRDLIFENPQWIEPKNKLATLLFLKGQNYDSSLLCEQILQVKVSKLGHIIYDTSCKHFLS